MIDTLKIRSQPLSKTALAAVSEISERRCLYAPGGELLWELTTSELVGSFDHRLGFRIRTDQAGRDCLELEGSVHKHLLGHNAFGGPLDAVSCGKYLVSALETSLRVDLGSADSWEVRRLDVALGFDLGSEDAVMERIASERFMVNSTTGRAKLSTYNTGWSTTRSNGGAYRLKCYAKGAEVHKHDSKRLKKIEGFDYRGLLKQASKIIRYEVEFHSPAIEKLTTHSRLGQLDSAHLHELAALKIGGFMRENMAASKRVRTSQSVEKRLREVHGERLGRVLYGTWLSLATNGEQWVRESMRRSTFYLQKKQLQDAGVSWVNTDVMKFEVTSCVPQDFEISLNSPYYLGAVAPEVQAALAPFAAAA